MRVSVVFLILLVTIRTSARENKNPFAELGNYIYTLAQPMDCGFNEVFFTITPEVARQNNLRALQASDTIHKTRTYDISMEFNRKGWIIHFSGTDGFAYQFEYDSLFMSNGITRISKVTRNEWGDGLILRRFEKRLTYDEFGNPTSFQDYSTAIYHYRYMNRMRYQYVYVTETQDGDTNLQVFKYDKKTGELYVRWKKRKYELLGIIPRFNGDRMPDTVRFSDKYFDCLDTIPDGRYESIFVNRTDSMFNPITRDSLGRFSEMRYGTRASRSVKYSGSGLPEGVIRYSIDGEIMVYSFIFTCSYF